MSLPNSEPLPENINELPPARQRHIRRQPRSASLAERQLLLESLISTTGPSLNFFLFSLLGAAAVGAALYLDDPAVLILALVILPFLRPAFGLALMPASRKAMPGLKSLISLGILLTLIFAAGVLAGYLRKEFAFSNLAVYRFSAPYWLDLALVGASSILAVFVLVREGARPRLIGVILAYEILLPLALAGFSLPLGASQWFPRTLLVSLTHLNLGILLAAVTFFMLGYGPRNLAGWLLILLFAVLVAGGLLLTLPGLPVASVLQADPSQTPQALTPSVSAAASNTPAAQPTSTEVSTKLPATETPFATLPPTASATQTLSPTQTLTPEPTSYWGIIDTLTGAVFRESPSFDAPVAGYLNDGDAVEIEGVLTEAGTIWYQVTTQEGQNGWLLGSLVNTQTPTPEPE